MKRLLAVMIVCAGIFCAGALVSLATPVDWWRCGLSAIGTVIILGVAIRGDR